MRRYNEFKDYCTKNDIDGFRTRYFHLKTNNNDHLQRNKFNTDRWSSYNIRDFCRIGVGLGDLFIAHRNNRAFYYRWRE